MLNIALVCVCHNRLKLTTNSFNKISKALKKTKKINKFHFFVLDDNSKDGTNYFLSNFENTSVLRSDRNLYWARGMLKCFNYFYNDIIKYDVLITFNDDINLNQINLNDLFRTYQKLLKSKKKFLLSVPSIFNKKITYGGKNYLFNSLIPKFKNVKPIRNKILKINAVNMNFVLIPMLVILQHGFFDKYFKHSLADYAFSLKLKKFGINSFLYDKAIIECKPNLGRSKKLQNIDIIPQEKFYKNYFKLYYYLRPIRFFLKKFLYRKKLSNQLILK